MRLTVAQRKAVLKAQLAERPPRRVPARVAPVLDAVKPLIEGMLREDLTAPRATG